MGLIPKIFGKGNTKAAPEPDSRQTPAMIQVFDAYGREFQISRETYRRDALLPSFEKNKANAEELYGSIVQALRDGFAQEALEPARTLATIDADAVRGQSTLGVVLLQLKRYEEARVVLEGVTRRLGEQGWVLTNLAKAYSGLGQAERAEQILWHALELDPNQDNGLGWYAVIFKEREGEAGTLAAYRRVAALPGSWRAQLWLARAALAGDDVKAAEALYRGVLGKLKEVPADALMQISGDLGNKGLLRSMIELCAPRFDASIHGLQVGNNLIKAYVDLKEPELARAIVSRLSALKRLDWHKSLLWWDDQIDKSQAQFGPIKTPPALEFGILTLDEPVWAHGALGFEALLPAKEEGLKILFMCGSGDPGAKQDDPVLKQATNELGRVTRALPMFLAEEVSIRCKVQTSFALPWIWQGGFVLSAKPWTFENLKAHQQARDFILLLHIDARTAPWGLQFSLLQGQDGSLVKTWEQDFELADSSAAILESVEAVVRSAGLLKRDRLPNDLPMPPRKNLPQYLGATEQALAVATATLGKEGSQLLYGERSIVDSLLRLALDTPENLRSRCLLLNTLEKEARRRPDIVREYADKLRLLQKEHPLPAGAAAELVKAAMDRLEAQIAMH